MTRNVTLGLLLTMLLSGCFFGECSYEDQVADVESFSEAEFSELYDEVSNLALKVGEFEEKLIKSDLDKNSPKLLSLEFNYIVMKKEEARLMLGGCFDNKAFLYFNELNKNSNSITIRYGDPQDPAPYYKVEVIWQKT